MSQTNLNITSEQVIPTFESTLFSDNPEATYAIGRIAVGSEPEAGMDAEFQSYLQLRANVYAYQTGMISEEHIEADGTERDVDDARSTHFAVIENKGAQNRVIGAMRLIIKSRENPALLPIEHFFSETFAHSPAPLGSVEFSRYICRHEDPRIQRFLKWPLYAATTSYIAQQNLGPSYGVVEEFLEKDFQRSGVPVVRVSEPKFVPKYNGLNLAVLIDTATVARRLGVDKENSGSPTAAAANKMVYIDNLTNIIRSAA